MILILLDLTLLILVILYFIQTSENIHDLPLINYWIMIDITLVILKYPYLILGKYFMEDTIHNSNISSI